LIQLQDTITKIGIIQLTNNKEDSQQQETTNKLR